MSLASLDEDLKIDRLAEAAKTGSKKEVQF